MTSYLSENEAKIYKMAMSWNGLSREPFGALRSVMTHFCTFHSLSFELNFFRPEFPFKYLKIGISSRKLTIKLVLYHAIFLPTCLAVGL